MGASAPVGRILGIADSAKEGDLLKPQLEYQGGNEGGSEFGWYRRTGAGAAPVKVSTARFVLLLSCG